MKKHIAALAALVLTLCLVSTPLAAENSKTVTAIPSPAVRFDVTAVCDIRTNYYELVLGSSPANRVTLPDGVTIQGFTPKPENNGLRVIIIPVTAADWPEAFTWASGRLTSLGSAPVIYYLMFYRGNERQETAEDVSITISPRTGYESASLYFMTGDESVAAAKLGYAKTDSGPSFVMAQNGYYSFLKSSSGGGYYYRPATPAAPKPSATTGDGFSPLLWGALFLSASGLAALPLLRRRTR